MDSEFVRFNFNNKVSVQRLSTIALKVLRGIFFNKIQIIEIQIHPKTFIDPKIGSFSTKSVYMY